MKMKNRVKKHSLKFISVFFSIFLWIYVLNSEKIKFEKTVSLEYIMTEGFIFAQKPPTEVTFLIEGPRAFVKTVAEREDRILIDISKSNPNRLRNFTVDLNPSLLNLPFGMIVERVLPRRISIHLEKKVSKIVPLKMQFTGRLPEGMSLENAHLNLDQVEVYGPRSVILELKELMTRPIDLGTLSGQDTIPAEVNFPDERLSLTSGSNISFSYELKSLYDHFILKSVPIKFLSQEHKIETKIKTADLKLVVPEKIKKNRLNISSSVQVWADIPTGKKGKLQVPLRVILPPGLELLEIIPKSIIVHVR